jgi:hypothetical protein
MQRLSGIRRGRSVVDYGGLGSTGSPPFIGHNWVAPVPLV